MIINHINENLWDTPESERTGLDIDTVSFDNESRTKRVQRLKSAKGTELALKLEPGFRELYDGDVLHKDGDSVIIAKIEPTDVIIIKPRSILEALSVAHGLGNRHLQAQFLGEDSSFGAEVMVVRRDHTVEHFLDHAEVPYSKDAHVMPEAFRHAEHTH